MADLTNLSFETAAIDGVTPASWTVTAQSSAESIDVMSDGLTADGFEIDWGADPYSYAFAPADITGATWAATPTPLSREGFEVGWANDAWGTTLVATARDFEYFPVGPLVAPVETFENEWAGDDEDTTFYSLAFSGLWGRDPPYNFFSVAAKTAYGTNPENFESSWRVTGYVSTWAGVTPTSYVFDGVRAAAAEGFEHYLPVTPINVLLPSGDWNWPSHGFSVGYQVLLSNDTGQLPQGFRPGVPYYVVVVSTANHVQLSETAAGATLVPGDLGTGVTLGAEEAEFWTTAL